ncbi:hypothetical protein MPTK1_2g12480 [Marchantia polymorpha subsp. ruderalis]|uniref:HMA domain-containing protein n=2 Tax=Marchantia polymorpha TaxID=3197 RepID=A0A176VK35_MARPO|nr:hypothetical protein AXG93_3256s1640 [Marchantia polymorpha subsp. ruderalis]PTQ43253.1 hypothetical protein MARPO_0026s0123 [Marchantia polymorpha]BBN02068.1 hypothetical protein Mp_2g12480 [Marchantia polymorpha subsp. ruderalis]|eukprot:PTQ43253.1 hypothetical protein MARPO_0026s0123 [Marchantia polymorpha]
MAMNQYERMYRGYTPAPWYSGYDQSWVLGRDEAPRRDRDESRQVPASSSALRREDYKQQGQRREEYKQSASPYAPRREDYRDETRRGVVELRMPLCCEGCVEKVHKKFTDMDGVASVECNTEKQKVTIRGTAKPEAVLRKAKKILSRSEFWKGKSVREF